MAYTWVSGKKIHSLRPSLISAAGDAFHNIKGDKLYPAVGMKKPGEHLQANFGQTSFVFDIDTMMEVSLTINSLAAI